MIFCLAVLVQYWLVTDIGGRTDGHMTIALYRASIASRAKNVQEETIGN